MKLRGSQLGLKTAMLAVAAAATNFAAAAPLISAPFMRRTSATAIVFGLFIVGVIVPAFWVGAVRRLSYDALLAHIAAVGILVFLFVSAVFANTLTPFILASFVAGVMAPSVAWYLVRGMDAGESRDRAGRLAMAYIKGTAQFAFGFGFWLMCLFALRRVIG